MGCGHPAHTDYPVSNIFAGAVSAQISPGGNRFKIRSKCQGVSFPTMAETVHGLDFTIPGPDLRPVQGDQQRSRSVQETGIMGP